MDFIFVGGLVWFMIYIPFVILCSIAAFFWYFIIKPRLKSHK